MSSLHQSVSSAPFLVLSAIQLQERLRDYEVAGWINEREYIDYTTLLNETLQEDSEVVASMYREQITRDLQKIAERAVKQTIVRTTKFSRNQPHDSHKQTLRKQIVSTEYKAIKKQHQPVPSILHSTNSNIANRNVSSTSIDTRNSLDSTGSIGRPSVGKKALRRVSWRDNDEHSTKENNSAIVSEQSKHYSQTNLNDSSKNQSPEPSTRLDPASAIHSFSAEKTPIRSNVKLLNNTSSDAVISDTLSHSPRMNTCILKPAEFVLLQDSKSVVETETMKEEVVQKLFVEMCFFARLGFVQPPCCLQCIYKGNIQEKKHLQHKTSNAVPAVPASELNTRNCMRWIVWRKKVGTDDSSTVLRPDTIDGNIVLLQCHVAQSLLDGELVDGVRWDMNTKQIVIPEIGVNNTSNQVNTKQ